LDFINGGYSLNSPTAAFWTNLATAVVFGLGIATVLTLIFTPAMLALRVWIWVILRYLVTVTAAALGRQGQTARDFTLAREAKRANNPEFIWDVEPYQVQSNVTADADDQAEASPKPKPKPKDQKKASKDENLAANSGKPASAAE
jgi:multidrug efflux pump